MFRKNYYLFILTIALFLAGSITAFAQNAQISGRVELKKADGATEPVAGALIEVLRIDQKVSFPGVKTDAAGNYTVSGIPNEGEYIVLVSGEKLKAATSDIVSFGAKNVNFVLAPGDGLKFSEEQIREALTKSGDLTAAQKAERAKIEAKNKNVMETNALVSKALAEGNKAFDAKNYDLAIAKFDEGYKASPDFVGSAPVLLNNKALSLSQRAVANYNKMVSSKDAAEKADLRPKVIQDFEESVDSYSKSWAVSKGANPTDIQDQKMFEQVKGQTLTGMQEVVRLMVRTKLVSTAKKNDVLSIMQEYTAFETDKAKKLTAQVSVGDYLIAAQDFDNAAVEYRKAVDMDSKNPDAVGGLGLALWTVTYETEDTARKQEALNYMQHFLDIAPKDHPLRDGIDSGVEDLKSQKLKPQKVAAKN